MPNETEATVQSKKQKVALPIKLFVFIVMVSITVWSLPNPAPSIQKGLRQPYGSDWILFVNQKYLKENAFIKNFVLSTGLWQSWDMFAPNPSNLNIWADEMVTFKDGTVKRHQYPRMEILSFTKRYLKERFRKFLERANSDDNAYLWPVFAQRIALENYSNPNNPPVKIELFRHFYFVQPPSRRTVEKYSDFKYFTYEVDQEQLRKLAAR